MGHNTNILKAIINTGKIYMKAQLLDPLLEADNDKKKGLYEKVSIYTATSNASAMTQILKNNLKNIPLTKDKAYANKTEKFRSVTEHGNEFLRSLKNKKNVIEEELFEDIDDEESNKKDKTNFHNNLYYKKKKKSLMMVFQMSLFQLFQTQMRVILNLIR